MMMQRFRSECDQITSIVQCDIQVIDFYRPQTVVREGFIFTGVCLSTGGCTPPRQTPPGQTLRHPPSRHFPPPRWPLQQMVRILPECILVGMLYDWGWGGVSCTYKPWDGGSPTFKPGVGGRGRVFFHIQT